MLELKLTFTEARHVARQLNGWHHPPRSARETACPICAKIHHKLSTAGNGEIPLVINVDGDD